MDLKTWLTTIPDPDERPWFGKPLWLPSRGITAVTDGKMLVTVKGKYTDDEADDITLKRFAPIIDAPDVDGIELDAAAIREWAGCARVVIQTDCVCKNGKIPCDCGDGQCECPCCDESHTCGICNGTAKVECEDCDNGKVSNWTEPRPGMIAGACVDRGRLAKIIEPLEGAVRLTTVKKIDALRLTQGDICCLIMQMVDVNDAPAFPDKGE